MQRAMKDSGIEWVKQIPEEWKTLRGKNILQLMKRLPGVDDEVITCFRDGEVTLRRNRREEGFTFSDKEIGYQGIKRGDLIIHGMDGFAGAIGISDSDGKGSPVLVVCTTKEDTRYLVYYLRTLAVQNVFLALATGVRERSCDLRWNKIAELLFLIPNCEEQHRIADYLDRKCGQIDAIIARQQEVIEKLKAYKRSVITEAVTKGLNPNVPMKESGIEWIGKIPADWDIRRLRFLCTIETGNMDTQDNNPEGEYPFYVRSPIVEHCDSFTFDNEAVLMAGDGVGAGKTFHYVKGKYGCHQRVYSLHSFTEVLGKYLYYYLLENFYKKIEESNAKSTVDSIRLPMIKDFPVVLPPYEIQGKTINYLDSKCEQIDATVTRKQALIEKLKAYKKSLIYEVVTGKKEV